MSPEKTAHPVNRVAKIFAFLLALAGILTITYFAVAARTDTFTGRWVAWKSSGVEDYLLFPSEPIQAPATAFQFEQSPQAFPIREVTYQFNGQARTASLEELLESTGTTAFLVLRGDAILYENYFNGYQRDSVVTSFSVAKSITALLLGLAIEDGFIQSLDEPVTNYLPELAGVDPGYRDITLQHLLAMKSGIAFKDTDIPWHDKSRAYYHPQLRQVVTSLPLSEPPGTNFVYNTFNPILLGMVIETATGQSVAGYTESRLWMRLGAEYEASWSLDSESDRMAKMESGFNARAIDYAKIGLLVLNRGNWDGEQLISSGWIEQATRVEDANLVPKLGENIHYQNGWWVIGPTPEDRYTVFAWGHLGQYIFIFPDDNMLVLRFGKEIGEVDSWRQIAQGLVNRLVEE